MGVSVTPHHTQRQSHTDTYSTGEKPSPGGIAAGGWRWVYAISREARSCHVRPTRGSADGGRSDRPASPHRALALRGPRFSLYLLGRNESARHQGFGLRPKHLDTPDGVPRSAGPRRAGRISREARSCHVRPARGSADGGHFDRPARRCWRPPGSSPGPAPWSPWR